MKFTHVIENNYELTNINNDKKENETMKKYEEMLNKMKEVRDKLHEEIYNKVSPHARYAWYYNDPHCFNKMHKRYNDLCDEIDQLFEAIRTADDAPAAILDEAKWIIGTLD